MDIHLNQTVSKENEKSETSVEYQEAEVKGEEKTDLSGQEETSSPGRDSWKMIPELISQQEHDNYIFIKFKNGAENDVQVHKGKSHFLVDDEPVASGSQTGASGFDSTSPDKSWNSHLDAPTFDPDFEGYSDDESELDEYGDVDDLNARLQHHLRDIYADHETDSFILQLLQDLDPSARYLLSENTNELLYPCNSKIKGTCEICLEVDVDTRERLCCKVPVCESCLKEYLKNEVKQRNVRIHCINCDSYVHRDEILALLPTELKEKYYQFLLEENKDPNIKTCPRCCMLQNKKDILPNSHSASPKKKKKKLSPGLKVICSKCGLTWCFDCHAPWHENIKCKEFRKGDKLVKNWAKEFSYGQQNAVKCPKCKIFIQKRSGCSHMTCRNCSTNFCYRCGHRYIQMKLIGKHSDRFSPFGCKYNLLPDRPVARKAVRGSVLGAKIFGGILLGGLIVAAAAVFVGGSVIIVPSYFGVKYYHWRKRQKMLKKIMQREQQNQDVSTLFEDIHQVPNVVQFVDNSDTMTSTESSSSNDLHGSTEVKVWVHSEIDLDADVKFKSQEQQTTPGNHDSSAITTAEVTMEDDVVVLHVKTTSKTTSGDVTVSEQEEDTGKDETENEFDEKKDEKGNDISVDTQGCFVKILGKLPVKWEKEYENEGKLKEIVLNGKPAIVKEKKRKLGTRRHRSQNDPLLESEKLDSVEKRDSLERLLNTTEVVPEEMLVSEIQQVKEVCDVIDPYLGIVSSETCDTGF